MFRRKLLALLGMSLVTAGMAAYAGIKDMQSKAKSTMLNHEDDAVKDEVQRIKRKKYENKVVPSRCGRLHVDGRQLVDQNGNPVQLKGISSHGLSWYPEFINAECFRELHEEWNMNLIRLAMYTDEEGGYCAEDGDQEALKQVVRNGVKYAAENDMYVIVDWHILRDYDPNMNKEAAIAFFDQMSAEFASCNHVIYELCNEPNMDCTWEQIRAYAEEVIPVIRKNDPNAVIIVGTPKWSQKVDKAAANPITIDNNLMYALHFYAGTHKEELRSTMISAIIAGLPIFVTEYGICDASGNGALDYESAQAWVDTMNAYNISYAMWNLGNRDESSCIVKADCKKTSGFDAADLNDSGKWLFKTLTGEEMK
ncbi:MAG: glycoside hydrolase family 5 protein [Clostridiales bacterium]|nr:glycoside hydrolase family 5 protein [Candidatus Blautia equi]